MEFPDNPKLGDEVFTADGHYIYQWSLEGGGCCWVKVADISTMQDAERFDGLS